MFYFYVLAFIDLFYRYHYPRYFIYSDCMGRHVCNNSYFNNFYHSLQKKTTFSMEFFL